MAAESPERLAGDQLFPGGTGLRLNRSVSPGFSPGCGRFRHEKQDDQTDQHACRCQEIKRRLQRKTGFKQSPDEWAQRQPAKKRNVQRSHREGFPTGRGELSKIRHQDWNHHSRPDTLDRPDDEERYPIRRNRKTEGRNDEQNQSRQQKWSSAQSVGDASAKGHGNRAGYHIDRE